MAKRRRVNWDYVEPLWRASKLSNMEIVRQYEEIHQRSSEWKKTVTEAAIRKRARQKGWRKDLVPEVKKRTREKLLVRDPVRDQADLEQDENIIEATSEALAGVIQTIRGDVMKTRAILARVRQEIIDNPDQVRLFSFRGDVTEHHVKMGTEEVTRAVRNLTTAEKAWVDNVWRAYGLGEDDDAETGAFEYNAYFGDPPEEEKS